MTNRKIAIASAMVAAGLVSPVALASSSELEALKARIAQLEAQQMSEAVRTAQVDAAVDAALLDAQKRSMFLAEGVTSGWDNGFVLGSADGKNTLQPYALLQFRYVLNSYDGVLSDDADVTDGFEVRRLRVGIKGNAFDTFKYNVRMAFDRDGGTAILENAYVEYKAADNLSIRAGQWTGTAFHEENISDENSLAAEHSLVNEVLGGGLTSYVQGVAVMLSEENMKAMLAFTDGAATGNTNYRSAVGEADWGIEGRIDYLVNGDWKDYADFSAQGNKADLLVVGGGFDWTQVGSSDAVAATVDVQWENTGGLGLYGAVNALWVRTDGEDPLDWGFLVQAGYMLPDSQVEVFGRVGLLILDDSSFVNGTDEDTFTEWTVGANYFFKKHNAKATLDLTFLPSGSPSTESGLGVVGGDEEQLVVRGQIQLAI